MTKKASAEATVRNIRRKTRRRWGGRLPVKVVGVQHQERKKLMGR